MTTIGSLFSGAGGLDLAVQAVFGGEILWHCENDPAAIKVLNARWPGTTGRGIANLGDIRRVDFNRVELVDILAGGFPCQDVSCGGRRGGLRDHDNRSGLWSYMANAIDYLQPSLVIIENVRGLLHATAHRTLGFHDANMGISTERPVLRAAGAVLGDLAELGYDAQWTTVTAASVGAPHRRERVFIVAHPAGRRWEWGRAAEQQGARLPAAGGNSRCLLPTPEAKNSHASQDYARATRPGAGGDDLVTAIVKGYESQWGKYAAAIGHWEHLTRPAPYPTEPNTKGNPRLNPQFSEWMMGWPPGWATAVHGITRNAQLQIIGNGVVPQQATAALRWLLTIPEPAAMQ